MKKINNWNSFNEGIAEFRKSTTILTDIVSRIDSDKVSDLTKCKKYSLIFYLLVFLNILFTCISLHLSNVINNLSSPLI